MTQSWWNMSKETGIKAKGKVHLCCDGYGEEAACKTSARSGYFRWLSPGKERKRGTMWELNALHISAQLMHFNVASERGKKYLCLIPRKTKMKSSCIQGRFMRLCLAEAWIYLQICIRNNWTRREREREWEREREREREKRTYSAA